jgi:hypothetical protein
MAIHSRFTRILAVIGAVTLSGASAVRAQEPTNAPPNDTSAAARSDTSGYSGYQNRTDTAQAGQGNVQTDSSGFKYTGPPTDTALKAKPGAQTGPTAGDSGMARETSAAGQADSVVCKDGSNAASGKKACRKHGGIDSVSTQAAMKARGMTRGADSTAAPADTSSRGGAASDTALKAKPGTQTGPDTGAAARQQSP